ncbi:MAG TPA: hypothetical protein DIW47_08580 [Bacteroidetes bacterium]|nr:hypothetical protein [Bacteroidota bacterium]
MLFLFSLLNKINKLKIVITVRVRIIVNLLLIKLQVKITPRVSTEKITKLVIQKLMASIAMISGSLSFIICL